MVDKHNELRNIISTTLGIKKEDIKDDSKFIDDLDADSLDIAELVLNIEDHFNIKVNDEEVGKFKTVKDVMDYLSRK